MKFTSKSTKFYFLSSSQVYLLLDAQHVTNCQLTANACFIVYLDVDRWIVGFFFCVLLCNLKRLLRYFGADRYGISTITFKILKMLWTLTATCLQTNRIAWRCKARYMRKINRQKMKIHRNISDANKSPIQLYCLFNLFVTSTDGVIIID